MSASPVGLREAKPVEAISLTLQGPVDLETAQRLLDLRSLYTLFSHTTLMILLAVFSVIVPVTHGAELISPRNPIFS